MTQSPPHRLLTESEIEKIKRYIDLSLPHEDVSRELEVAQCQAFLAALLADREELVRQNAIAIKALEDIDRTTHDCGESRSPESIEAENALKAIRSPQKP